MMSGAVPSIQQKDPCWEAVGNENDLKEAEGDFGEEVVENLVNLSGATHKAPPSVKDAHAFCRKSNTLKPNRAREDRTSFKDNKKNIISN